MIEEEEKERPNPEAEPEVEPGGEAGWFLLAAITLFIGLGIGFLLWGRDGSTNGTIVSAVPPTPAGQVTVTPENHEHSAARYALSGVGSARRTGIFGRYSTLACPAYDAITVAAVATALTVPDKTETEAYHFGYDCTRTSRAGTWMVSPFISTTLASSLKLSSRV